MTVMSVKLSFGHWGSRVWVHFSLFASWRSCSGWTLRGCVAFGILKWCTQGKVEARLRSGRSLCGSCLNEFESMHPCVQTCGWCGPRMLAFKFEIIYGLWRGLTVNSKVNKQGYTRRLLRSMYHEVHQRFWARIADFLTVASFSMPVSRLWLQHSMLTTPFHCTNTFPDKFEIIYHNNEIILQIVLLLYNNIIVKGKLALHPRSIGKHIKFSRRSTPWLGNLHHYYC